MEQKLYFGHPVNTYDTELEQFLRKVIADTFPEWIIVDPNTPQHERGYIRWKEKTGVGLDYFLKYLLPRCHRGIFLPFRSGYWPSGEALEIQCLAAKKIAASFRTMPSAYGDRCLYVVLDPAPEGVDVKRHVERLLNLSIR